MKIPQKEWLQKVSFKVPFVKYLDQSTQKKAEENAREQGLWQLQDMVKCIGKRSSGCQDKVRVLLIHLCISALRWVYETA
jgi:hypothetical protein